MSDNVWDAGADGPEGPGTALAASDELPELGTLLNRTIDDVKENLLGYLMVGLPLFIAQMAFVAVMMMLLPMQAVLALRLRRSTKYS